MHVQFWAMSNMLLQSVHSITSYHIRVYPYCDHYILQSVHSITSYHILVYPYCDHYILQSVHSITSYHILVYPYCDHYILQSVHSITSYHIRVYPYCDYYIPSCWPGQEGGWLCGTLPDSSKQQLEIPRWVCEVTFVIEGRCDGGRVKWWYVW